MRLHTNAAIAPAVDSNALGAASVSRDVGHKCEPLLPYYRSFGSPRPAGQPEVLRAPCHRSRHELSPTCSA
jgi:hypothetical protein